MAKSTATTMSHTATGGPGESKPVPMQRLLIAIMVMSVLGLGVAGYLTYAHFNEGALMCTFGGCETVQSSQYATIGPIPIAMLGVGMFATLLGLAALRLTNASILSAEKASIVAWAMLLTGILYYVYLTYVELFVLDAICQWCVASSLVALVIFGLETVYIWRTTMAEEALDIE